MDTTPFKQVANNAQSTLASGINNSATSISVQTGHGARFPAPGNGFYATIWNSSAYPNPFSDPNMEVVLVTARSTDTLTVTRAQRGTSGVSHSSGDDIRELIDSTFISDLNTAVNTLEKYTGGKYGYKLFDDCWADLNTAATVGPYSISTTATNGTARQSTSNVAAGIPGVWDLSTSASTSGDAGVGYARPFILLGGGTISIEWMINLSALSALADEYIVRVGLGTGSSATDFTNGVYFEYNRLSSVNWLRCTADNSSRTKTASSTAVAAGSWVKLRIDINAAASSAEFFVNGTSIGTNSTNIPTAAGRYVAPAAHIKKSAGTTPCVLSTDFYELIHLLTSAR